MTDQSPRFKPGAGEETQEGRAQRTDHIRPPHTDRTPPRGTRRVDVPVSGQRHASSPRSTRVAPPPRRPANRQRGALYLPWWSLMLMLAGVMVVSFTIIGIIIMLGNTAPGSGSSQPIIRIITAEPTTPGRVSDPVSGAIAPSTQIIAGGERVGGLELSGPTLAPVVLTSTPVPLSVGSRVTVQGVGTQQLNIRDNPGVLGSSVRFRAEQGEQFQIVNGPRQADGFTWWEIRDPFNANRSGWAVSNYLEVMVEEQP